MRSRVSRVSRVSDTVSNTPARDRGVCTRPPPLGGATHDTRASALDDWRPNDRPSVGPAPGDATAAHGDAPATALVVPVAVEVPLRLASVNVRRAWEHWAARARRVRRERAAVRAAFRGHAPPVLPVVARLTRVGWNALDDDNLRPALKSTRDEIASWLGVDDRSPLVRWEYRQQTTRRRRFVHDGMGRGRWETACAVRIVVKHVGGAL
jgi:hypothetical protein